MIRQQTLDRALCPCRQVAKPQFEGTVTDLIVADEAAPAPRPQAFLVEQIPHWTLPTHFHQEHQFQVFVAGGGTIGRKPVERLDVHYASPHSAYGPLTAGTEGISYLTLRAVGDTGAWYLPEQRGHLKLRIAKQQAHAGPASHITAEELRALAQPTVETLIAPTPEGLAAWMLRLPPAHRTPAPAAAQAGGGRFYVVTQGGLQTATGELPALGTAFVSADDRLDLAAGAEGLEVLVLQFPAAAAGSFIEAMASGEA